MYFFLNVWCNYSREVLVLKFEKVSFCRNLVMGMIKIDEMIKIDCDYWILHGEHFWMCDF